MWIYNHNGNTILHIPMQKWLILKWCKCITNKIAIIISKDNAYTLSPTVTIQTIHIKFITTIPALHTVGTWNQILKFYDGQVFNM